MSRQLVRVSRRAAHFFFKNFGCQAQAVGILAASGQAQVPQDRSIALLGELALDGSIRPVRGALSVALAARAAVRWIQDRALEFGIDPAKVAAYGESDAARLLADKMRGPLGQNAVIDNNRGLAPNANGVPGKSTEVIFDQGTLADVAVGVVCGFGADSYELGLRGLLGSAALKESR